MVSIDEEPENDKAFDLFILFILIAIVLLIANIDGKIEVTKNGKTIEPTYLR